MAWYRIKTISMAFSESPEDSSSGAATSFCLVCQLLKLTILVFRVLSQFHPEIVLHPDLGCVFSIVNACSLVNLCSVCVT